MVDLPRVYLQILGDCSRLRARTGVLESSYHRENAPGAKETEEPEVKEEFRSPCGCLFSVELTAIGQILVKPIRPRANPVGCKNCRADAIEAIVGCELSWVLGAFRGS